MAVPLEKEKSWCQNRIALKRAAVAAITYNLLCGR